MLKCLFFLGAPLFYMENVRKNILCLYLESKFALLQKLWRIFGQILAFRVGLGLFGPNSPVSAQKSQKKFYISAWVCRSLANRPLFQCGSLGFAPPDTMGAPERFILDLENPRQGFRAASPPKNFFSGPDVKNGQKTKKNRKIFFASKSLWEHS